MYLNQSYRSSLLLSRFFIRTVPHLKSSNFISIISRKPLLLKKTDYKLIYDFPLIHFPVAIVKSGPTCVFLSVVSSPFIYYMTESILICITTVVSASLHFVMGSLFSKALGHIAGKIYVNKEGEPKKVMISFMDTIGRRIDRIHEADDIVNCECRDKITQKLGFIHIAIDNSDFNYKINVRNCKIYDQAVWESLFGKMSILDLCNIKINPDSQIKKIK